MKKKSKNLLISWMEVKHCTCDFCVVVVLFNKSFVLYKTKLQVIVNQYTHKVNLAVLSYGLCSTFVH